MWELVIHNIKPLYSGAAIALTFIAFLPYLYSILKNEIQAHVFSWVIWGSTTLVVFFALLAVKGGVGVWPIGVSACLTILIAVIAFFKRGDISITRSDWSFFILAMLSLPLWYLTADPLWAVLVLTFVDLLGFGPTYRKAHAAPHSESIPFYALFILRNILVILALSQFTLTTLMFPVAIAIACSGLIIMIVVRRFIVPKLNKV